MNHDWLKKSACRDHETLKPDDWFEMNQYGFPNDRGMAALGVCVTSCPVQEKCLKYTSDYGLRAAVAGGGWFDNKGDFHKKMPDEIIDSIAVGAMFGISQAAIRHLVKLEVIPSAGKSSAGRHVFVVSELLARKDRVNQMAKELTEWEKRRKVELARLAERRQNRATKRATAEQWEREGTWPKVFAAR